MRTLTRSLAPVLIAAAALSACGSDNLGYGDPSADGLSAVKVDGAFGKVPVISWTAVPSTPKDALTSTLIPGTGEAIPEDQAVKANIYLSDVQSDIQAQALCTNSASAAPHASASASAAPSAAATTPAACTAGFPVKAKVVPFNETDNLIELPASTDKSTLVGALRANAKIGSRVEALVPASMIAALIPASAQQQGISVEHFVTGLQIGNADSVLMVVDFVKLGAVTPKAVDVPATQMPALVEKDGNPTGFNFTGIAAPKATDPLKRVILTEGDGDPVTLTSTITVNYLGVVYKGAKPFDESYTSTAKTFPLANLVQGWQYGLNGIAVGSRVLLQVPPSLGYGATARDGIPANSTLYFVLDIVSAQ